MPREVSLWEYLPPYLKRFREFQALFEAEQPEFQGLVNNCERTLENSFIQTAHHEGLTRFERLLQLNPSQEDNLDSRRTRIMVHWNDLIPYTIRTLKDKIAIIQGNDQIDIFYSDPYEIMIKTKLDQYGQMENLNRLLAAIIPCNLVINVENTFTLEKYTVNGNAYTAGAVSITEMIMLTTS